MQQPLTEFIEVDSHRIKTIRALIAEDAYVINADDIVGKFIDIEIALTEAQNDPR